MKSKINQFGSKRNLSMLFLAMFFFSTIGYVSASSGLLSFRSSSDTTTLYYETWNSSSEFGLQTADGDHGTTLEWTEVSSKPTTSSTETIRCTKDIGDDVYCDVWDGNTATLQSVITLNARTSKGFDVAYEYGGDLQGIVCWIDSTGTTPQCNVWDGSDLDAQADANDVGDGMYSLDLFSDKNSDYIAMMVKEDDDQLSTQIWTGSSWGANQQFTTGLGGVGLNDGLRQYAGTWLDSGDFLAVWFDDAEDEIDGALWTRDSGWGSQMDAIIDSTASIDTSDVVHVMLENNPDPNNDQAILLIIEGDGGVFTNDYTDGSWGGQQKINDVSLAGFIDLDNKPADLKFEESGDYEGMAVYGGDDIVYYRVWTGSSWESEQSLTNMPSGEEVDWMQLDVDPNTENLIIVTQGDINDLNTMFWDGDSWGGTWNLVVENTNDVYHTGKFVFDYTTTSGPAPTTVTLIAPADSSNSFDATHSFNATFTTGNDLDNATFFLWNSTGSLINQTLNIISGTSASVNLSVTLPYFDTFTWNYFAVDNESISDWGDANFTITYQDQDLTPPSISIDFPTATTYTSDVDVLNFTASDNVGIYNCWYSNDSGVHNYTNYGDEFYDQASTGFYAGEDNYVSRAIPPVDALPPDGTTEANAGDYEDIAINEGTMWQSAPQDVDGYQWFQYYLTPGNDYSQLVLYWNGDQDDTASDQDLYFYLWNYDTSTWQDLTDYGCPPVTTFSEVEKTCTINTNVASYIDTDGEVSFMVYAHVSGASGSTQTMKTDYLSLTASSAPGCSNFTGLVSNEGSNTWTIWANDTSGNINSDSVTFSKEWASTDVTVCRTLDIAQTYTLTQNISSTGTCITIGASGVTLDGDGHRITYATGGNSGEGVEITGYDNFVLKNIDIYQTDTSRTGSCDGIDMDNSDNFLMDNVYMFIEGSDLSSSNGRGIYADGPINNFTVQNSYIETDNLDGMGIRMQDTTGGLLDDINIINSTIYTTGGGSSSCSCGVRILGSTGDLDTVTVLNSNITAIGSSSSDALWLDSDNILGVGQLFINNSYIQGAGEGLVLEFGTPSSYIYDSVFDSGASDNDVQLSANQQGPVYFINSTFVDEDESVLSGTLIRQWYFNAHVKDTGGSPIVSATALLSNVSGDQQFSVPTDAGGNIAQQLATAYVNVAGTPSSYNDHEFNVSKAGYETNSSILTISGNQNLQITLGVSAGDESPPTYSGQSVSTTVAGASATFEITAMDETALETNGYYIFSTNNSGVWENESDVNFTSTPETIQTIKTLTASVGATIGYRWYIWDNNSNMNQTEIYTLTTTETEEINACQDLDVENRVYTITGDITAQTDTCFDILADNITLNCAGHLVDGTDVLNTYGVDARNGFVRLTVQNCLFTDWDMGLWIEANYTTLTNVNSTSNRGNGIRIQDSSFYDLTNVKVTSNGQVDTSGGLYIDDIDDSTFTNIESGLNSNAGIDMTHASTGNTFLNLNIYSNVNYGIVDELASSDNTFTNVISQNNRAGIIINIDGNNVNITNMTTYDNDELGVFVIESDSVNIQDLTTYSNVNGGLYIENSTGSVINNVHTYSNTYEGVWLINANDCNFTNINSHDNGNNGFVMAESDGNILNNVSVVDNYDGLWVQRYAPTGGDSDNNYFINIFSSGNDHGYYVEYGDGNTLTNSTIQNSDTYGVQFDNIGTGNLIYNNIFNNSDNAGITNGDGVNYWNVTMQLGDRIISNGTYIGGNYWTNSTGTGYSDTCTDYNHDGFCDTALNVVDGAEGCSSNNCDYLVLSNNYAICSLDFVLSGTLSNSIYWDVATIPSTNLSAEGNNGAGATDYYVTITATGCTGDLQIKANAPLTSGGSTIPIVNQMYSFDTSDNTVPSTTKTSLTDSYENVATGLSSSTVYLKYYLNVSTGQSAGVYNNTLGINLIETP